MYRFRETESYEGKSILTNGTTNVSEKALKHLGKVGKLRSIKGYVYASKRDGDSQAIIRIGVLVTGDKGSVRFGGFLWGYHGQGPRGLESLFKTLEIKGVDVFTLCDGSPNYSSSSIGEWWKMTFDDEGKYTLEIKRRCPPLRFAA